MLLANNFHNAQIQLIVIQMSKKLDEREEGLIILLQFIDARRVHKQRIGFTKLAKVLEKFKRVPSVPDISFKFKKEENRNEEYQLSVQEYRQFIKAKKKNQKKRRQADTLKLLAVRHQYLVLTRSFQTIQSSSRRQSQLVKVESRMFMQLKKRAKKILLSVLALNCLRTRVESAMARGLKQEGLKALLEKSKRVQNMGRIEELQSLLINSKIYTALKQIKNYVQFRQFLSSKVKVASIILRPILVRAIAPSFILVKTIYYRLFQFSISESFVPRCQSRLSERFSLRNERSRSITNGEKSFELVNNKINAIQKCLKQDKMKSLSTVFNKQVSYRLAAALQILYQNMCSSKCQEALFFRLASILLKIYKRSKSQWFSNIKRQAVKNNSRIKKFELSRFRRSITVGFKEKQVQPIVSVLRGFFDSRLKHSYLKLKNALLRKSVKPASNVSKFINNYKRHKSVRPARDQDKENFKLQSKYEPQLQLGGPLQFNYETILGQRSRYLITPKEKIEKLRKKYF